MILAAFGVFRHLPMRGLSVCAEGLTEPYRSSGVFIGNNEYSLTPPAFGRREKLDGGRLRIYVTKAQGHFALFRLAGRTVLGRLCASSSAKPGGWSGWLSGFAKSAFLVLLEVLHVEVTVGFQPVLMRLDRQGSHQPAA